MTVTFFDVDRQKIHVCHSSSACKSMFRVYIEQDEETKKRHKENKTERLVPCTGIVDDSMSMHITVGQAKLLIQALENCIEEVEESD